MQSCGYRAFLAGVDPPWHSAGLQEKCDQLKLRLRLKILTDMRSVTAGLFLLRGDRTAQRRLHALKQRGLKRLDGK